MGFYIGERLIHRVVDFIFKSIKSISLGYEMRMQNIGFLLYGISGLVLNKHTHFFPENDKHSEKRYHKD